MEYSVKPVDLILDKFDVLFPKNVLVKSILKVVRIEEDGCRTELTKIEEAHYSLQIGNKIKPNLSRIERGTWDAHISQCKRFYNRGVHRYLNEIKNELWKVEGATMLLDSRRYNDHGSLEYTCSLKREYRAVEMSSSLIWGVHIEQLKRNLIAKGILNIEKL